MDILDCKICYLCYNESSRRPRSLRCGHTFCELCIQRSIRDEVLHCPTCRTVHNITTSTALPVNFDLAELMGQMTISTESSSPSISDGSCAAMCPEHPTSALYFYCSTHKTNICRECTVLEHSTENCKLKSLADELRHKKRLNILLVDAQMKGLTESIEELESDIQAKDELIKALQQDQGIAREQRQQASDKHKNLLAAREKLINTFNIDDVNTITKHFIKSIGEIIPILVSKGPGNEAYTLLENNGKSYSAKITLQNKRLHLHTLRDTSPPNFAFTLPYTAIREEFSNDSALVFLDIKWGNSAEVRVYIRLYGETDRGKQFIFLVTGEKGKSYINTKTHKLNQGVDGFLGGFLEGKWKSPPLLQNLKEWGEYKRPRRAGQVAGVGINGKYDNSAFCVLLQDDSRNVSRTSFGFVEEGLELLTEVNRITSVDGIIIECGIVIEICDKNK